MAALPNGATVDVRLTYGPLLIGVFFNMILYGVVATQQLAYLESTRRDRWPTKLFVWSIFVVLTANTVFDMHMMFQVTILQYGAPLDKLPTLFVTQPLSVVLVGFPIQIFFIWRIRSLTTFTIIPVVIFLFSLVSFSGGVWTVVMVPIAGTFRNIPLLYRSAEVWLISSAVTDLSIAATLAAILRAHKTGYRTTDTIVDKLVRMTVQTGLITALCSVLDVVCFLTPALRGETVNFIWNIPLPKLYAICLMSTLNARESLSAAMSNARDVLTSGEFLGTAVTVAPRTHNVDLERRPPRQAEKSETRTVSEEDQADEHKSSPVEFAGDALSTTSEQRQ
ncbi:hypothetical protein HMN09_01280700 [Mycena chlorophos]|uniref:DUF6534 domain-containing protein n=1 Tax=Mycena chlorophos TaxID=658473 RepID=A0A8H6VT51_MYCCL|nr:hypothetical protein HMN09_01280700 [Mycena chlorophos]